MGNCFMHVKHVSRGVFDRVSDRISKEGLKNTVTIYYNGTDLYGDISIEGKPGYSDDYKNALIIFTEEYCK